MTLRRSWTPAAAVSKPPCAVACSALVEAPSGACDDSRGKICSKLRVEDLHRRGRAACSA
eukprot:2000876-Heterocapsa_arctica.AAC.1